MKRSTINRKIQNTIAIAEKYNFALPKFAYWCLDDWKNNRSQVNDIIQLMLGWDVTDFGEGDFDSTGAVLFTLRNGDISNRKVGVPYAEKLIHLNYKTEQKIPFHYHKVKTEDIINRAGGILVLELYNSTPDDKLDLKSNVIVKMDGITRSFSPGEKICVMPGESITLPPGLFHTFWLRKDSGETLIGEISSVNDDNNDNIFLNRIQRFGTVEDDEAVVYPLCSEYKTLLCNN